MNLNCICFQLRVENQFLRARFLCHPRCFFTDPSKATITDSLDSQQTDLTLFALRKIMFRLQKGREPRIVRNLQSISYLLTWIIEYPSKGLTESSVETVLTEFDKIIETARRQWALVMAHGPYPDGRPNLYIQVNKIIYIYNII